MAIALGTGFSIGSKDLIYDKFVLSKDEMLNINENTYPDQFFALCSDDDCMYTFNINNPVNAETGKFRIVIGSGTGGGGASTADAVTYENTGVDTEIDNVKEALDKLFNKVYYVAPSITSFTASSSGGIFEVGHVVSAPITFNWNYNKDIITQTLTDCPIADETVRTATYNSDITTDKTFTLNASDGENAVSKSISYKFVYPYYVGVLNTNTPTETDIIGLTKKVEAKGNKTLEFTTSQSYMAFAYPNSYGNVSKIVDQNGFDVTVSFTKSTVIVNSVDYYVYISNKNSGDYSMKINY